MKIVRTASSGNSLSGDAKVTVEPGEGMQIVVISPVEDLFYDSIVLCAKKVLKELKAPGVKVVIEDSGAFEWVIAARIETALKRGAKEENWR